MPGLEHSSQDAEKMRDLVERALVINEREYGSDHRLVAPTLTNLGIAYGALGDAGKKRHLLEKTLVIKEREYGSDHRVVAKTLKSLQCVWCSGGCQEKA